MTESSKLNTFKLQKLQVKTFPENILKLDAEESEDDVFLQSSVKSPWMNKVFPEK